MAVQLSFDNASDVEILAQEIAYQGFFTIKNYYLKHKLFAGGWSNVFKREVFERNSVAAVLPYDPALDQIVLIEQFRVGALKATNPWLLEIPAGVQDGLETMESMIQRELYEECGLTTNNLLKICEYWVSPGGSNEYLTLFCAKVDAAKANGIHGLEEENEDILAHIVTSEKAFSLLKEGKICNAVTIIALQWLMLNKSLLADQWG